jgi:hypothetical protein
VDGGHESLNDCEQGSKTVSLHVARKRQDEWEGRTSEVVVEDLGEGSKAVGGARSVGDDLVLGLVLLKVDTADEHGGVGRRSRDDNLLGSTLEVDGGGSLQRKRKICQSARASQIQAKSQTGTYGGGEHTGGLDNVVGSGRSPLDVGRVSLREDGDRLAVDDKLAVLGLDGTLEDT